MNRVDDPANSDVVASLVHELDDIRVASEDDQRAFKTAAATAVVEQRRATGELYALTPLYFETNRRRPGRLLRDDESRPDEWRYGFDSDGRLRTAADPANGIESYFGYELGQIVERRWTGLNHPWSRTEQPTVTAAVLLDDAGRPVVHAGVTKHQPGRFFASAYGYDGPRLVRFSQYTDNGPQPWLTYRYRVSWSPAGRVERIELEDAPGVPPLYQASTRRLTAVLADARKVLVDRIPARLAGFNPPDRVYGLALGFSASSKEELMPPQLGLMLACHRSAWLVANGDGDADELWNPILPVDSPLALDFPALDLDDENLIGLGTEVAMLLHTEEELEALTQTYVRVAKTLNRLDWTAILPITDDFVVFPVEYEAGRYLDLIERAVPAARVRKLRAAGLLPTA